MFTLSDGAGRSRVHPVEKRESGSVEPVGVLEIRCVPDVLDDVQFGIGEAGGERGAALRDDSGVERAQKGAGRLDVGRERALHEGRARERDQTDAVSAQPLEREGDLGLGPLQPVGQVQTLFNELLAQGFFVHR